MASRPTASVVIATLRRPDVLRGSLAAAVREQPLEVLVVDGDEQASARAVVEEVGGTHLASPRGLTRQRNRGLDAARGEVTVFVDDDAVLRPGALHALLDAYADADVVGATGRVVEPASNRRLGKQSAVRRVLGSRQGTMTGFGYPRRLVDEDVPGDLEFLSGCFMSARTSLAREVRFDERLSGYGLAEDEDFGYRLSRRGRLRYVPAAVVDHDNSGFGGRDRRAFGRTVVVNRAYLFRKNFPDAGPLDRAGFAGLVAALAAHRLANGDPEGARGVLAGAREAARSWRTGEWDV